MKITPLDAALESLLPVFVDSATKITTHLTWLHKSKQKRKYSHAKYVHYQNIKEDGNHIFVVVVCENGFITNILTETFSSGDF